MLDIIAFSCHDGTRCPLAPTCNRGFPLLLAGLTTKVWTDSEAPDSWSVGGTKHESLLARMVLRPRGSHNCALIGLIRVMGQSQSIRMDFIIQTCGASGGTKRKLLQHTTNTEASKSIFSCYASLGRAPFIVEHLTRFNKRVQESPQPVASNFLSLCINSFTRD